MNALRGAFIGFLAGFVVAVCAYQWVWLEMRINVGIVIPLATLLSASLHLRRKPPFDALRVAALEIGLIGIILLCYRFQFGALLVVPATLFKEGFYLSGLSLAASNLILAIAFLGGIFACAEIPGRLRACIPLRK